MVKGCGYFVKHISGNPRALVDFVGVHAGAAYLRSKPCCSFALPLEFRLNHVPNMQCAFHKKREPFNLLIKTEGSALPRKLISTKRLTPNDVNIPLAYSRFLKFCRFSV